MRPERALWRFVPRIVAYPKFHKYFSSMGQVAPLHFDRHRPAIYLDHGIFTRLVGEIFLL
jgi:hypothetical protein